jgi:TonB family protein
VINSRFVSIRVNPPKGFGSGSSRVGGTLQIGQLSSSVAPLYPADAARQGVEGSVKLHLMVGSDGRVETVQVVSGPPALLAVAMVAVHEWRYTPTLLGGQPVGSEHDATLSFRLNAQTAQSK